MDMYGSYDKRPDFSKNQDSCNGIHHLLVSWRTKIVHFDILLLTTAFILSFGNVLSKNPYMSDTFRIPLHCVIYFLMSFLLSYMCFKKVQKTCSLSFHLLIVASIFLLMFAFFFLHITYNDDNLNLPIRIFLSAGIGMFLVCVYSLHVYYENKAHVD